jgi:hypothetical protein
MSAPCVTSSYLYLSEWPQPFPASSKRNSILAQERFSQTRGSCGARLRRTMMQAAEALTAAGLAGAVLAGRSRAAAALSGAALMAASALTRFGVFEAGRASARDPKYTVGPQRERRREQGEPTARR